MASRCEEILKVCGPQHIIRPFQCFQKPVITSTLIICLHFDIQPQVFQRIKECGQEDFTNNFLFLGGKQPNSILVPWDCFYFLCTIYTFQFDTPPSLTHTCRHTHVHTHTSNIFMGARFSSPNFFWGVIAGNCPGQPFHPRA